MNRTWRAPQARLFRHGEPGGYRPLREAIADYLATTRGVRCEWRQVIITSGGQQSVDLTVKGLTDPGDQVWIEEPGYSGQRGPLLAAGLEMVPVPLDREGFDLRAAKTKAPAARLAIVTPSHHYPLGIVMSLARRLELLEWAAQTGGYILEDDYDSEYRYAGRPLAALQGLDREGRVIYAGSFSKVLFASLRLGYLVVPPALAEPMVTMRRALDDHPSVLAQPALARFFREGYFAAHVRRLRQLYSLRQEALLAAAHLHLSGLLEVSPDEAGMHLVADLAEPLARRMNDQAVAARAAAAGVTVTPLAEYYLGSPDRQGLLLGYAAVPEETIAEKVSVLAAALRDPTLALI